MSLYFLALDCFPRYMEAPQSREFVYALQQREVNGEQLPIRTVSVGLVSLQNTLIHDRQPAIIRHRDSSFKQVDCFDECLLPVALRRLLAPQKYQIMIGKVFCFFFRVYPERLGVGWG